MVCVNTQGMTIVSALFPNVPFQLKSILRATFELRCRINLGLDHHIE